MKKFGLLLFSLCVTVLLLEFILRLAHIAETQSEKNGHEHYSLYGQQIGNHYRLLRWNTVYQNKTAEFDYAHTINRFGFVGKEPTLPKTGKRILVFGDSFTEGVGAFSPDSAVPALLQRTLQARGADSVEVINMGNGGSDVVFETKYIIDSVLRFEPDVVVMIFTLSDISDIIQWGGEERFRADGSAHSKEGPWWSSFYAQSRLVRLFFANGLRYDSELLLCKEDYAVAKENAWQTVLQTAVKANDFCQAKKVSFVLVLLPTGHELANQSTKQQPKQDFNHLSRQCAVAGVKCINLFEPMQKVVSQNNLTQYAWIKDGHYNHRGYQLVAQLLADSLPLGAK